MSACVIVVLENIESKNGLVGWPPIGHDSTSTTARTYYHKTNNMIESEHVPVQLFGVFLSRAAGSQ
jgi:hypothetical protein